MPEENKKYLLDTDICVYLLNNNKKLKQKVREVCVERIGVSVVTVAELHYGAFYSQKRRENLERIKDFLAEPGPKIYLADQDVAVEFGRIKANLRREGKIISDFDLVIAAIALVHTCVLATNNTEHFERVKELKIENWLAD